MMLLVLSVFLALCALALFTSVFSDHFSVCVCVSQFHFADAQKYFFLLLVSLMTFTLTERCVCVHTLCVHIMSVCFAGYLCGNLSKKPDVSLTSLLFCSVEQLVASLKCVFVVMS